MPLFTCPDCGASVSDAAPACPRCARPFVAAAQPQRAARKVPVAGYTTWGCMTHLLAFLAAAPLGLLGSMLTGNFIGWLAAPAVLFVGYVLGKALSWKSACGACRTVVSDDARVCQACHAALT